jgi:hypothetical protein
MFLAPPPGLLSHTRSKSCPPTPPLRSPPRPHPSPAPAVAGRRCQDAGDQRSIAPRGSGQTQPGKDSKLQRSKASAPGSEGQQGWDRDFLGHQAGVLSPKCRQFKLGGVVRSSPHLSVLPLRLAGLHCPLGLPSAPTSAAPGMSERDKRATRQFRDGQMPGFSDTRELQRF